jgi:hypothetical protein
MDFDLEEIRVEQAMMAVMPADDYRIERVPLKVVRYNYHLTDQLMERRGQRGNTRYQSYSLTTSL